MSCAARRWLGDSGEERSSFSGCRQNNPKILLSALWGEKNAAILVIAFIPAGLTEGWSPLAKPRLAVSWARQGGSTGLREPAVTSLGRGNQEESERVRAPGEGALGLEGDSEKLCLWEGAGRGQLLQEGGPARGPAIPCFEQSKLKF